MWYLLTSFKFYKLDRKPKNDLTKLTQQFWLWLKADTIVQPQNQDISPKMLKKKEL